MRERLTYSNVMATIAVFAAFGGGAVAATRFVDSDGQIRACVKKRSGQVRVVKPRMSCWRGEEKVTWLSAQRLASELGGSRGGARLAPLKPGETLTGVIGGTHDTDSGDRLIGESESFPIRPPSTPEPVIAGPATDPDKYCGGTADNPEVVPGYLCLWVTLQDNARTVTPGTGPTGFGIEWYSVDAGTTRVRARWFYKAP